ncbi:MAG: hypothetical protein DWQ34_14615 [Planctomycetota bacterium]|nr:MAG: hypothetical protein DWQ29_13705 [Planctomycetota bacterium]REJ91669.1 MAG: hypothetical protein DWQ34_14615 [Planctomycetota bacterium]REK19963.1 MAG: hypothetical protein DWQ41_26940 [Planctomycetota bacterium]REK27530.1 MAG: hypothetical protein DWQ45_25960 [Planctomycetota bacterium]
MKRTLLAVMLVAWPGFSTAEDVIEIGSRRELFVDEALVDRLAGNATLRLHHPTPQEVVLVHDEPWEGSASAYHSVFRDGDRYRMYYRAWRLTIESGQLRTNANSLCYAESPDGLHWEKPQLGLHDYEGSTANNIVISSAAAAEQQARIGGPAVFRDDSPHAPPEARYKAFLISRSPLGMWPYQSADGIHFSPMTDGPTITNGAFDSQNLAFWDSVRGEYRAYWRYFTEGVTNSETWAPQGIRAIRTATSPDLVTWENEADLAYVDSPPEQLYENGVAPYHRAPHLLIGFPVRYIDRSNTPSSTESKGRDTDESDQALDWPASLRALPDFEKRKARAASSERYGTAITEGLFMASRDGVTFKRWNEAFLRPGIERPGTWNYGQQFVAWHPVETPSQLPDAPNELSFYATEDYWTGEGGTSLRRYSLRLDGFVSANAPMNGGELVTKPFTFAGQSLSLNFATSAAGSLRVELQDADGTPLPEFTLDDCDELFGDTLDRTVTWQDRRDVSSLAGTPVRLRFVLQDADLFSFQFQE